MRCVLRLSLVYYIFQSPNRCHRSLVEKYNRKKREREQEERERLFKLVEQQYRYKSETYDSAQNYAGSPEVNGERIRLEVTESGEVRERAQTMTCK